MGSERTYLSARLKWAITYVTPCPALRLVALVPVQDVVLRLEDKTVEVGKLRRKDVEFRDIVVRDPPPVLVKKRPSNSQGF
jgi:hypothetical protein